MAYRSLYWEDVEEGQALPEFTYELSLHRLVAMVRASGNFDYVHYDRDYARAAGARDPFISTPHVCGLFGRLLTDWSGPDAAIRSLTVRMNTQSCCNDILSISGNVGRRYRDEDGEHLVDLVNLNIAHHLAPNAASASATLSLPSRTKERTPSVRMPNPEPETELNDVTPVFAKAWFGRAKPGLPEPAKPLTEHEIHLWCECIEDWNPLYWNHDFATKSRHGGIIAPPTAMFLGAGSGAYLGVGYGKPGTEVPQAVRDGLTGLALLRELRGGMELAPFIPPGCPEVAAIVAHDDFYTPLRPGDTATAEAKLLSCSAEKTTRLGTGYFLTWIILFLNQRGELIKRGTRTAFHYRT